MKNLRIEKIKKDKIIIVHGILGASDEGLVTRLKKMFTSLIMMLMFMVVVAK